MRRGHGGGAAPVPAAPLTAVCDDLRLRVRAHRRALADAEARDDTAALRALCRDGLALIAELEALAALAGASAGVLEGRLPSDAGRTEAARAHTIPAGRG